MIVDETDAILLMEDENRDNIVTFQYPIAFRLPGLFQRVLSIN